MFTDYVVRKGDGLLTTLLTSNLAFPQGGCSSSTACRSRRDSPSGTPVTAGRDPARRHPDAGGVPDPHAHGNQTSPVHRGDLVRENMMCQATSRRRPRT